MRHNPISCVALISFLFFSLSVKSSFCQEQEREKKEEKAEARLKSTQLQPSQAPYKLSATAGIFSGYDSNVRLDPISKGDIFEEVLYSLTFVKPLPEELRFQFNYDLDYLNYNQYNKSTNILNHVRFGAYKRIGPFEFGSGYDFSHFYYPHFNKGEFLFQKGFFSLRNYLSKQLYHQLVFEAGLKWHAERKALADTIATYQDKRLRDERISGEYDIATTLLPKTFIRLKARFTVNDSNARYQDFYDYKSYEVSPSLNYKLLRSLELNSSVSYMRRLYKSRLAVDRNYREKDDVYSANGGIRYSLDKNNILSLLYTYRNNSSNDSFEKYTENMVTCGWQYYF